MALTLKKFNPDLQKQLRIIALEQELTLNQLIEMLLVEAIRKYQKKREKKT